MDDSRLGLFLLDRLQYESPACAHQFDCSYISHRPLPLAFLSVSHPAGQQLLRSGGLPCPKLELLVWHLHEQLASARSMFILLAIRTVSIPPPGPLRMWC